MKRGKHSLTLARGSFRAMCSVGEMWGWLLFSPCLYCEIGWERETAGLGEGVKKLSPPPLSKTRHHSHSFPHHGAECWKKELKDSEKRQGRLGFLGNGRGLEGTGRDDRGQWILAWMAGKTGKMQRR